MKQSKRPYYSLEFKQDAVSLVLSKGYRIPEAASNLGISASALRAWVRAEQGVSQGKSNGTLSLSEHAELVQLRKENSKLKMEREILKKAAAFFAQEQG